MDSAGQPGPQRPRKPRSDRLTEEEYETLVALAVRALPRGKPYQVATAIMGHAREHLAKRITRQVAQNILNRARARIRVEAAAILPDLEADYLLNMRDLWAEAEKEGDRKTRVELIKIALQLASTKPPAAGQNETRLVGVDFEIVDPANPAGAGGGAADHPDAAGPAVPGDGAASAGEGGNSGSNPVEAAGA